MTPENAVARSWIVPLYLAVTCVLAVPQARAAHSIREIIDATGDGAGNTLTSPQGVCVDASGNVYVTDR